MEIRGTQTFQGEFSLKESIIVPSDATMIIEAGAKFLFTRDAGIICKGTLIAEGTKDNPIIFDEMHQNNGWEGIRFWHSSKSKLSHCIITHGKGHYDHEDDWMETYGGGLLIVDSSPTIDNCQIVGCKVTLEGGGIYCWDHSSPVITNCTIRDNHAKGNGGGIYCWDHCSPTIKNCIIRDNNTRGDGGGIYCWEYCSPTIEHCEFINNTAVRGNDVYCTHESTITIKSN